MESKHHFPVTWLGCSALSTPVSTELQNDALSAELFKPRAGKVMRSVETVVSDATCWCQCQDVAFLVTERHSHGCWQQDRSGNMTGTAVPSRNWRSPHISARQSSSGMMWGVLIAE